MHIKARGQEILEASNATVRMSSGDHISVEYTSPDGRSEVITLSAQHLVFLARHEGTDTSIICRPGGVTTVD